MTTITQLSPAFPTATLPAASAPESKSPSHKPNGDSVQISSNAKTLFDSIKDVHLRAVEKLQQRIKYNGFPYESPYFKFMEKSFPNLFC